MSTIMIIIDEIVRSTLTKQCRVGFKRHIAPRSSCSFLPEVSRQSGDIVILYLLLPKMLHVLFFKDSNIFSFSFNKKQQEAHTPERWIFWLERLRRGTIIMMKCTRQRVVIWNDQFCRIQLAIKLRMLRSVRGPLGMHKERVVGGAIGFKKKLFNNFKGILSYGTSLVMSVSNFEDNSSP